MRRALHPPPHAGGYKVCEMFELISRLEPGRPRLDLGALFSGE